MRGIESAVFRINEYKEELENIVKSNVKEGRINQAIFYLCKELPKVIRGYLRELNRNSEAEFYNQVEIEKNKKLQGELTPQINAYFSMEGYPMLNDPTK